MKMKKPRLDNGDYMPYENGHNTGNKNSPKNLISQQRPHLPAMNI